LSLSGESIRERLSALSRAELGGLVLLVVLTLAGAGFWYVRSLPRPVELRAGLGPSGGPRASASPSSVPPPIIVDVAGWVRRPGVYAFHLGDRVIDAINRAGGPRRGAALESLNLAAPLADGTQILVPREAEQSAAPGSSPAPGGAPAKINVNTADATALEALPGVGEVLAQRIIDYRTQNGPFTSVDQLEDVSGIGPSILEEIRDLVTV